MVVPISVSAQFRRLDKNLRELKSSQISALSEDQSILVAEICNSCILTLDKAMNALWEAKGEKKESKQKPNMYFPIMTASKEKLAEKFQQYQMRNLEENEPKVFEIIDAVQSYRGIKWLPALYEIASIRHEDYPRISQAIEKGVGFGRGQDIYIESTTTDANGNINFKGYGTNRESGKTEPVRVEFMHEVRSVLESVSEDPYQFCFSSVEKVKHLVSELYRHLS